MLLGNVYFLSFFGRVEISQYCRDTILTKAQFAQQDKGSLLGFVQLNIWIS